MMTGRFDRSPVHLMDGTAEPRQYSLDDMHAPLWARWCWWISVLVCNRLSCQLKGTSIFLCIGLYISHKRIVASSFLFSNSQPKIGDRVVFCKECVMFNQYHFSTFFSLFNSPSICFIFQRWRYMISPTCTNCEENIVISSSVFFLVVSEHTFHSNFSVVV